MHIAVHRYIFLGSRLVVGHSRNVNMLVFAFRCLSSVSITILLEIPVVFKSDARR